MAFLASPRGQEIAQLCAANPGTGYPVVRGEENTAQAVMVRIEAGPPPVFEFYQNPHSYYMNNTSSASTSGATATGSGTSSSSTGGTQNSTTGTTTQPTASTDPAYSLLNPQVSNVPPAMPFMIYPPPASNAAAWSNYYQMQMQHQAIAPAGTTAINAINENMLTQLNTVADALHIPRPPTLASISPRTPEAARAAWDTFFTNLHNSPEYQALAAASAANPGRGIVLNSTTNIYFRGPGDFYIYYNPMTGTRS